MMTRHSIVMQLAFVALLFCSQAITQEQELPLDLIHRGIDPEKVYETARSLRITDSSAPEVVSAEQVNLQGQGPVWRFNLRYSVSVTNSGSSTTYFRIRTEIPAIGITDASSQTVISAGSTVRKSIEFDAYTARNAHCLVQLAPLYMTLLDHSDTERDEESDYVNLARSVRDATPSLIRSIDLGIAGITISSRNSGTSAYVGVQNLGTERWGYPTSIGLTIYQGQPASLHTLGRDASASRQLDIERLSGDLRPCVARGFWIDLPLVLAPGVVYTAVAELESRDDQNPGNNAHTRVFIVERDRQLSPVID